MKKIIIFIFLGLSLFSGLYLVGWNIFQQADGHTTKNYHRLQTKDGFNAWGLLSPIQSESQETERITKKVTRKIIFPHAPKFEMVEPTNYGINEVTAVIKNIVDSTRQAIEIEYGLDYDGTSQSVREYQNPETLKTQVISTKITSLSVTASPEAREDGFLASMQPGVFEEKNNLLAWDRAYAVRNQLQTIGIDVPDSVISAYEAQFTNAEEAAQAEKNPQRLDAMRYAEFTIETIVSKPAVTTTTAPFLLPLFLLGIWGLVYLLRNIGRPKFSSIKPTTPNFESLKEIILILLKILIAVITIALVMYFSRNIFIMLLILAAISVVGYLLWKYGKNIYEALRWLVISALIALSMIPKAIWAFFRKIFRWIDRWRRKFIVCWQRGLSPCWQKWVIGLCILTLVEAIVIAT